MILILSVSDNGGLIAFRVVKNELDATTNQILAAQTGVFTITLLVFMCRYFTLIRVSEDENHGFFIAVAVISYAFFQAIFAFNFELGGLTQDTFG